MEGSFVCPAFKKVRRQAMERMQALQHNTTTINHHSRVSKLGMKGRGRPHSNPTARISNNPIFCLTSSFNFASTGLGRTKIPLSVTIFVTLAAYQNSRSSKHLPSTFLSQNVNTGKRGMKEMDIVKVL
jgi:hypothetical protein